MNEIGKIIEIMSHYKGYIFGDKGESVTVDDIIDLLEKQIPKLLSLDEALDWIDAPCDKRPVIFAEYHGEWSIECINPVSDFDRADIVGYGEDIRLWTAWPIEEQREAEPWHLK